MTITDVVVTDVGLSDHFFVKSRVAASIDRSPIVRSTFLNWKRLDMNKFKDKLHSSAVYMQSATTAEAFRRPARRVRDHDFTRRADPMVHQHVETAKARELLALR